MNISITARGYKAPERLRNYITAKLSRKERLYEGVIDREIILSYEKQTQVAEFKVKINNKILIAREKSEDIFKSIDMALDNAERQLKRYKEKRRDHDNKKMVDNLVA
jgi:putative sigma-54 modulation protein